VTEYTFHAVEAADIGDGEVRRIVIGGREIALYHIDGSFYATDDGCTHEQASLADGFIDGTAIECPLHGGSFDIKTGRAIAPPCTVDLRTYPVKRDGARVLVGVPIG
jgi:nitrite reductase/ring-hydroxylating ferredoxin subunit